MRPGRRFLPVCERSRRYLLCVVKRTIGLLVLSLALAGSASAATATISWQTDVATRGRVAYGVGGLYLYSAREAAPAHSHTITLTDLAPSTTYDYQAGPIRGQVTTDPLPMGARFGVDRTHVTANGSLVFPVLSYWQCEQTAAAAVEAGVTMFLQAPYTGCDAARPNDFSIGAIPASVRVLSDSYATDLAGSAGWYLPDEPDGWGIPPEQMPHLPPAAATGRLRVVNVSQHFYSAQAPINATFDRGDYTRFAALGDLVGFDMYPIVKFCGRVPLLDVYRAQRELMRVYAPGKPTFQWIETGRMTGECNAMQVTPEIVNAESWLAVAGGACGIGYFTSSWTGELWQRWDLSPGVAAQLSKTTAQLRALAPALCIGTTGDVAVPWDSGVAATSRTLNGALYLLAINTTDAQKSVPMRVDTLAGRTLTLLGTTHTIRPARKIFLRDTLEPFQVHVYVAAP
ncbi:MAG: hypothetical protein QOF43_1069 [Gaiellaceae bacterium]|nr:hypothetical protein [Gaiellaceae bacterium]